MTAMSGALQCSIAREIKIKLYGGRLQFKCPEKDIINIDGTDCIKVNSRTRAWILAACGVANVELETDDDEKHWKHAYSLASTPGWKSLLDARYEHCQRNLQDDEESKRTEEKKTLFGESESPNKGSKIPRAVALKWRDEPELIDVHVGGGRTIRLERAARRSAIPVVALIAANIEDFILHLGKDLTLESLTPRSYGQNDEKGVYSKTIRDPVYDREYNYKFKLGDAGKHVALDSDASHCSDGSDLEDTPDGALEDAPQDSNDVIDAGDIAPEGDI